MAASTHKRIHAFTHVLMMPEKRREIKAVLFDLGETLLTFGQVKALYQRRAGA